MRKKKTGKLNGLAVERYHAECVEIDPDGLDEEFIRTPADLAYWNERVTLAVEERERAKVERERVEGALMINPEFLEAIERLVGKKPNLDQLKGAIAQDAGYKEAKRREIDAEVEKTRCKGVVDALVTKRDMLISAGAHIREEMRQDLRLRDLDD